LRRGARCWPADFRRDFAGEFGKEFPMTEFFSRRSMLATSALAASGFLTLDAALAQVPLNPTPECHDGDAATLRQTEGPFFKPSSPERAELIEPGMAGQPIELVGFVLTRACRPVPGALVDLWQADDKGEYDNSGFRLRGHQRADAEGRYRFRTIVHPPCPHQGCAARGPAAHHTAAGLVGARQCQRYNWPRTACSAASC
jgi:protocatechuate 3,4-dioxygenase beta subunit